MSGPARIACRDGQNSTKQTNSVTKMGEKIKMKRHFLPEEIVSKILVGLPAKSVMRFSCVSKKWLSLINDPYFVKSYNARSYAHPDGINLIVCKEVLDYRFDGADCSAFYTDPLGKSPLKRLTLPPQPRGFHLEKRDLEKIHSVRGLVFVGKCVWNPTTNKSIVLPSFDNNGYREYFLGFDSSNRTYKVLCIILIQVNYTIVNYLGKILELGGSSWRDIEFSPSLLQTLTESQYCFKNKIRKLCSIDNLIFFFFGRIIVAFDFRCEKFEVISIPDSLTETAHMIQVGECLALINDEISTMWILEDYKKHQWKTKSLNNVGTLLEVIKFKVKSKITCMKITPVGAIHTSNEILLHIRVDCREFSKQFCYNYDINRKTYRMVPKLTQSMDGILDPDMVRGVETLFYFKKHVECIYRLM